MKEIFFLNGLPRAGNTLFSSIMNQNPKVAVSANSICADMMGGLFSLKKIDIFQNYPDHKSFDNVAAKVRIGKQTISLIGHLGVCHLILGFLKCIVRTLKLLF